MLLPQRRGCAKGKAPGRSFPGEPGRPRGSPTKKSGAGREFPVVAGRVMLNVVTLRMGAARFCRAGRVWAAGWLVGAAAAPSAAPPVAGTGPATVEATPLTGFTLTGFGADGFKAWDLQGRQALVQPPGQSEDIPIKNLQLRLFNGGEPL